MRKTLLLLLSIYALCPNSRAQECVGEECYEQKKTNPQTTFLLPINVALPEKKRVNLAVSVPSGYKKIQETQKEKVVFYEFIPEADDIANWTEILLAQCYINSGFTAESYIAIVKNRIMENAHDVKIHSQATQKRKNYTTSVFCASYTYNNRRELVLARYYSGPYDCAGFQYTINMTTTESVALEKVRKLESESVSVLEF